VSFAGRFTPMKGIPVLFLMGGLVDSRVGLEAVPKIKVSAATGIRNLILWFDP